MEERIAKNILELLGGNRFLLVSGSKNITHGKDKQGNIFLNICLPKNNTFLTVTLNHNNLYNMSFYRENDNEIIIIKEYSNILNDKLQEIVSNETGLNVSL